jgi:hypothetical protein
MQKLTYFEATSDGMLSMLSYGMLSDGMLSSSNDKLKAQRKGWKKTPLDEPTVPRREHQRTW